jgi:lipopolysaccharide transport system permease protein
MQKFSASPRALFAGLWNHRQLIKSLTQREIQGRYRGSFMGLFWSFVTPVFMLAVYTFVFSVVFKARWNPASDSKTEFALVLFAGLLVFNIFSECIGKSPALILSNANYVKKVVFPLEVLPLVSLGGALFHFTVSLGVWLLAHLIFFGTLHATVLWMPLVILPLILLIMGLSWVMASIGVYLRDISQFIGLVLSVFMFMSPIFYPVSALPVEYQTLLMFNPITPTIEMTRAVLYGGKVPDPNLWLIQMCIGISAAFAGFAWFQKTRKGFADVL